MSFPCALPRRGTQLFVVARSPGAVCQQRERRGRYLAGRTRSNRYSDTDTAAVALSYTRVHTATVVEGGREIAQRVRSFSLLFFPIHNNMLYALSCHSRNASRLPHCPGHVLRFVFSRFLYTSSLLYLYTYYNTIVFVGRPST